MSLTDAGHPAQRSFPNMARKRQPQPEQPPMTKHSLSTAPRHDHIVQGATVQAPHIYAEGHQLTTSEAGFLNRALINKVGSGLGQKLKKEAEKKSIKVEDYINGGEFDLQAEFDSHFANFDMDATRERGAGAAAADPVARRAREIAEKQFRQLPKVQAAGVGKLMKTPATVDSGFANKWAELVSKYLASRPDITALAEQQIAAERQMVPAEDVEEDFDALLDSIETPAAAE